MTDRSRTSNLAIAQTAIDRCFRLASYTEEPGVITRTFLSAPMRAVHADVAAWMTAAGMDVTIDAAGNIRGVYAAATPDTNVFVVGSHLDTVPHAGAFDGILGVMLGISLVERLAGRRLPFAVEVIGFSEEEGVRFGVPFIGSRGVVGRLDSDILARADAGGISVTDAIRAFGLDPATIPLARHTTPPLGYLEIHIEQGPVLDRLGLPLGVVRAITGQTRATVTFTGASGHAGTTPMTDRSDALAAAAEWIGEVERDARNTPGLVATVGHVDVSPNAGNVIPGRCAASLDVRHEDDAVRARAVDRLRRAVGEIATRRGIAADWQVSLEQPTVGMSAALRDVLVDAVASAGTAVHIMPSGAGHDAMVVAAAMPAAMLFIRSPGGISHHPDETVLVDDVATAIAAAGAFLDLLADTSNA